MTNGGVEKGGRGGKRTEGGSTPSKGEGSEGGREREGEEEGGGGRRGGVMNALTVTTSSIKRPHYTLIRAHTCANTHTHTPACAHGGVHAVTFRR